MTGHSLGELVAATCAGVLTPADAAKLVLVRADAMQAMPPGSMAAVFAGADTVRELLPAALDLAGVNTDRETVVSGPYEDVSAFLAVLRDRGINSTPLRTSHAFHSRSMAEARGPVLAAFAGVQLRPPAVPLLSAAAGTMVTERATDLAFWADQLVEPVRFAEAVGTLSRRASEGRRRLIALEVGPGQALSGMVGAHPDAAAAGLGAVPVFRRTRAGDPPARAADLLAALGTAWCAGAAVDWAAVDAGVRPDGPRCPATATSGAVLRRRSAAGGRGRRPAGGQRPADRVRPGHRVRAGGRDRAEPERGTVGPDAAEPAAAEPVRAAPVSGAASPRRTPRRTPAVCRARRRRPGRAVLAPELDRDATCARRTRTARATRSCCCPPTGPPPAGCSSRSSSPAAGSSGPARHGVRAAGPGRRARRRRRGPAGPAARRPRAQGRPPQRVVYATAFDGWDPVDPQLRTASWSWPSVARCG